MSRVEIYREKVREHYEPAPLPMSEGGGGMLSVLVPAGPGKWHWRFISNGHTMADSGQGYSRRIDALNGCARVLGAQIRKTSPELVRHAKFGGPELIEVFDLTKAAS